MSDNYTISQQYHEKKDVYIYVVKLAVRVQKEDFGEFKTLAQTYNGYYSSYHGVHGFVFHSEEDAASFGKELDEQLEILYEAQEAAEEETEDDDEVVLPDTLNNTLSDILPSIVINTETKWSRKMSDDETNNFFLSRTEYDSWGEAILKVRISNLGYYINSDGNLTISCEIFRTDLSDRWANLFVAIYDSKNMIREKSIVDYLHGDMFSKPCLCSCTEIKPSQILKIKLFWE